MHETILKGYAAGGAIPSPQKNVEKDFLKKYWARWKAGHVGRWYVICWDYIYICIQSYRAFQCVQLLLLS
jgi:hypothetical protein